MNKQQIKWASLHDWFISSHVLANGTLGVKVNDDMKAGYFLRFDSFIKLTLWAGY